MKVYSGQPSDLKQNKKEETIDRLLFRKKKEETGGETHTHKHT